MDFETQNFKPLADRLLVRVKPSDEMTSSGIIIPDVAKERPLIAKVESVGPDVTQLAVGDEIIFQKYSGHEFEKDGVQHVVLREEDVLAVVEG